LLTEECVIRVGTETLAATKIFAESGNAPSVVYCHGFGATATRSHIRYLLEYIAGYGVSSVCFDFSGNGQSTGKLEKATLALRTQEAVAAAKFLARPDSLTIIGTSMGGHIASLVTSEISVRSLILFCPAAYPAEVADCEFNEAFIALTKRPGAYVDSPAFKVLNTYKGNLLIVAAGQDMVIPKEVPALYADSAPLARSKKLVWVKECDHKIHPWLQQHERERTSVLREVLAVAMDTGRTNLS
jgi:pimeloyl-ACP methyl ester carboxylesterase